MSEQLFTSWQAEVSQELQHANEQLAKAIASATVAEHAHAEAHVQHAALRDAVAKRLSGQPVADALARRLQGATPDMQQITGDLTRARGLVANIRSQIVDLEVAQQQLRALLDQLEVEEEDLADALG
jgi:DNA-binding transcriptional MocR family regulator